MRQILSLLLLFCCTFVLKAHSADISATSLIEDDAFNRSLHISTAMTAFQYEIQTKFPEMNMDTLTPAVFQILIIEHLKENITLHMNGQTEAIAFGKAAVRLGHQTDVKLDLERIAETIKTLSVRNTSFANIGKNRSAFKIISSKVHSKRFILEEKNGHQVELNFTKEGYVSASENTNLFRQYFLGACLVSLLGIGFIWKGNYF